MLAEAIVKPGHSSPTMAKHRKTSFKILFVKFLNKILPKDVFRALMRIVSYFVRKTRAIKRGFQRPVRELLYSI